MENNDEILMEGVKTIAEAVEPVLDSAAEAVNDAVVEPVVKAAKKAAKRTKTAAKRGRKAVEDVAKDAAKAADTAVKTVAKAAPMKPELYVQYDFNQIDISGVVDAAKAAFKAEHSRVAVKSCKIYVKPQERAAYYVINDDFTGKLDL